MARQEPPMSTIYDSSPAETGIRWRFMSMVGLRPFDQVSDDNPVFLYDLQRLRWPKAPTIQHLNH